MKVPSFPWKKSFGSEHFLGPRTRGEMRPAVQMGNSHKQAKEFRFYKSLGRRGGLKFYMCEVFVLFLKQENLGFCFVLGRPVLWRLHQNRERRRVGEPRTSLVKR